MEVVVQPLPAQEAAQIRKMDPLLFQVSLHAPLLAAR
jgi:hypothetical protein